MLLHSNTNPELWASFWCIYYNTQNFFYHSQESYFVNDLHIRLIYFHIFPLNYWYFLKNHLQFGKVRIAGKLKNIVHKLCRFSVVNRDGNAKE